MTVYQSVDPSFSAGTPRHFFFNSRQHPDECTVITTETMHKATMKYLQSNMHMKNGQGILNREKICTSLSFHCVALQIATLEVWGNNK